MKDDTFDNKEFTTLMLLTSAILALRPSSEVNKDSNKPVISVAVRDAFDLFEDLCHHCSKNNIKITQPSAIKTTQQKIKQ